MEESAVETIISELDSCVCEYCRLRLMQVTDPFRYQPVSIPPSDLSSEAIPCRLCLGILPHVASLGYIKDLADSINELGIESSDFRLTVSTPLSIDVRDTFILRKFEIEMPAVKETLKWCVGASIGSAIQRRFSPGSHFVIELNFHSELDEAALVARWVTKPRKRSSKDINPIAASSIRSLTKYQLETSIYYPFRGPTLCATCEMHAYHLPIAVAGLYRKLDRNISQSPFNRGETTSVQAEIGSLVSKVCGASSYNLHGAGREDIDVRMLGCRPFILTLNEPRHIPTPDELRDVECSMQCLSVRAMSLRVVPLAFQEQIAKAEREKRKRYRCVIVASRSLTEDDVTKLRSFEYVQLQQKTPLRVLQRRSALFRPRKVYDMDLTLIQGNPKVGLFDLTTDAGTYVKEFVHGDLGRTQPNLGSILSCRMDIVQLDVIGLEMTGMLRDFMPDEDGLRWFENHGMA